MSRYDVNAANTNRIVRFKVEPTNSGDRAANLFGMNKGVANSYPHYGQNNSPTLVQELAQLRTSLVTRALCRYAIAVGVQLAPDAGSNASGAVIISFETDESGVFFNNSWPANPTGVAKHIVTTINDTVGVGGMSSTKSKAGLQTLLDSLYNVSYDGGVSGPFGNLSGTSGGPGYITLPDGRQVTGGPVLDNAGGGVTTTSGLTVTFLTQ